MMKNLKLISSWSLSGKIRQAVKLMTILFLCFAVQAYSVPGTGDFQQKTVTGKVVDNAGNPLAGVNIIEKGTTNGTMTDPDGKYTINVASSNSVLAISFIGFITQEITVGSLSVVDIKLLENVNTLEEVVVTGYTTQVRKNLSGSISTVQSDQLKAAPPSTAAMSRLQGQAAGVTVLTENRPGGDAIIRIRGVGTINDSDPLYVIDGVPSGPGNNLSSDDIESITILKDAASAAIYGSRGANGVVIITTKRGRTGQQPSIELNIRTGITKGINQYDLLNTNEYAQAVWLAYKNQGVAPSHAQYGSGATPVIPDYILPAGKMEGDPSVDPALYDFPDYVIFKANKTGTNWYDEIYRNGVVSEYDLSVRGGGNKATYSFSGNYLDEDGLLIYTNFKRYTFRLNSDAQFNNWFKAGQSMQLIYINEHGDMSNSGEGAPISQAYRAQPIIPVYDIKGNFAGTKAPEMGNAANPVAQLYRAQNNTGQWARAVGNFFGEFTIIKGLTLKSLFGYNFGQWNAKYYTIPTFESSEPNKVNGLSVNSNYSLQWNWTNTLNYIATFADVHKLNVLFGTEAIENNYSSLNASRSQYFSEDPDYMQLDAGEINKDNSGNSSSWSLFSLFGRVNYDFMGRYLLEATVRRDGSSRFGSENRYGTFPAVSVGWTMTEENFMAGTKNWLNFMKVRAGWGMSGNDRIGNYNSYSTYASDKYTASYALDGSNTSAITGFQPSTMGNDQVTWETTVTMNFGIDAMLLNNNLTVAFDLWQRNTQDMLYRLPVPDVNGLATPPFINVAEMSNKGFDLELGYRNTAFGDKFRYSLKATLSHYKNELTKISSNVKDYIPGANERQMEYTRAEVGTSFPEFYGYEVAGIFQTATEASGYPAYGSTTYNAAGHYKFVNQLTVDTNGDKEPDATDGIISPDDRTYIGNPHPDLTGGLNVDLGYGGLSLGMFFYGSYGNDLINYVTRWIDYGMFNGGLSKAALNETWTSTNTGARLPMLDYSDISQQPSQAFVEDGSFLRLKNMRISYTLPKNLLNKIQIKNLTIYAQMTNLFTLTKYRGLDPEIYQSGTYMGMDNGSWPTPRQVMFGINLGL